MSKTFEDLKPGTKIIFQMFPSKEKYTFGIIEKIQDDILAALIQFEDQAKWGQLAIGKRRIDYYLENNYCAILD